MVVKGSATGRPGKLAAHLNRTDHNEQVLIREISGLNARTIKEALHELHDLGAAAETRRTMYHGIINPRQGEELNEKQRDFAVRHMALKLGLGNQPYIVVEHVKHDREQHFHVIWSRIDLDRMAGISDSHNFRKHEEVSRELERLFGHALTMGVHTRNKSNDPRPPRTPAHAEMQQAQRTGFDPADARGLVTDIWKRTDTGAKFAEAIEQEGFLLARGDRRDFVLVDAAGGIHSLARRIENAKAKDIRDRLGDLRADDVPSVAEAKERMRLIRLAQAQEQQQDFTSPADRIRAEELKREREAKAGTRPTLSHADEEILLAVWQLERIGAITHIPGKPAAEQRPEPEIPQPALQPSPRLSPSLAQSPQPLPPSQRETLMQRLDREARERGDAEIQVKIEPAQKRERVLKLELDRPKPRPGEPGYRA